MEFCQEEEEMGIISLIQMSYFMYGHYKSDTNELFYIGIGRKELFIVRFMQEHINVHHGQEIIYG